MAAAADYMVQHGQKETKKKCQQFSDDQSGQLGSKLCLIYKLVLTNTANMCSGIIVEVHLKNCNFEKLQFFTVDPCSLYFLQIKNCNFNIIFM